MGKQGPCCHCGVKSTPLWRNGPPGKPVLCNACGSRWRTKGTLANYTPLHARTFQPLDSEDSLNSQEDKVPYKTKLKNMLMTVYNEGDVEDGEIFVGYDLCPTDIEDDTSNRSSSGSAISFSESCAQLGSMDGNEISGSVHSSLWDSHIPSKKRSRTRRHSPSPLEKLRRDLFDILQEQESSYISGSLEEVLIFEREDPMFSDEIGLGGVLLKPHFSFTEEESESQSSEISSSQEGKDRMIRDIGSREELKENPAKQSAFTNKFLGTTLFSNPDVLQSKHSSQTQINLKPSNNESFTPQNDITSCSSCLIGVGISLPAKRHLDPPYFPASGGTSFDISSGFKKPKEQMVVPNPSAFSVGRNSSMLSMMPEQIERLDKDLQMRAHSEISCPVVGFPCTSQASALQKGGQSR